MSAVRPIWHRGRPNRLDSLEPFDDLLARLREFLAGSSRVEFDTLGRFPSAEKQDEKLLENIQWDLIQILFSPTCNHRQLVNDVLKTAPLDRLKALLKPLQARYVVGYQFTTRPLYYPITPQEHPQFDQVNVPLYLLRQNEFDASLYFLNALKTNFPGWIRKTQVDITWLVVIDDLLKYSVVRQQNSFVARVFSAIEIAHFYVTSLVTNLFLAIWLDQRDTAVVIYEAITDIPYSGDWFLDSTHDSLYKYFFEPSDEATLACRRVFYKQRRRLLGIPPKIGLWEPSKQPDALKLAEFKNKLLQVIPYRSSVDYQDTGNKYSKQPRYRF
ncbi:hypothetical protein H4R35_002859 [Dimargaris xerosporica]|nr:hypothetical protein H4R35_002859 [Dimargaris xerosporica]